MAFCPNCGTQVNDGIQFCPSCGTAIAAAAGYAAPQQPVQAPPAQAYQAPPAQAYQQNQAPPQQFYQGAPMVNDVEANKGMAILAYILFFVPLIAGTHKTSPYAKFHTNQGTILFCFAVAWSIILSILSAILVAITFGVGAYGLASVFSLLISLLYLVPLALVIIGIINAAGGKMTPLPVIGNMFTIIK